MIWTVAFWKGAGERAIKTFFQTFVALIGTSAVILQDVDWLFILSGSVLAAVLSIATSIGNANFTAGNEPVVVEVTPEAPLVEVHTGK